MLHECLGLFGKFIGKYIFPLYEPGESWRARMNKGVWGKLAAGPGQSPLVGGKADCFVIT
jgi:hypothetical protein